MFMKIGIRRLSIHYARKVAGSNSLRVSLMKREEQKDFVSN